MADVTDYSDIQQSAMNEIVERDNGFHTSFYIADSPFYDMITELENGATDIKSDALVSLTLGGTSYAVEVRYSEEQECWFFVFSYNDEEIRGIVHYNTIYNCKGEIAFVFLNDNAVEGEEDISLSLPYTNVMVLRK